MAFEMAFKKISYIAQIFWHFRYYALSAALALAFWETPFIKPFRFFVVLVHEVNHAAAALLTGGEVVEMRTHWNESGHTLTRGGFFPLISAAGYVGSALWGALLIYTSLYPQAQRLSLLVVGASSLGMTMKYTPLGGIDFFLGIGGGFLLVAMAIKSPRAARVGAVWMGIMLCLYSLHDFQTDLLYVPERTDAGILAMYLGMTAESAYLLAYPIALSWVLFSLSVMYRSMRALVRAERKKRSA
ncbi:MAG: hypothetical protein ACI906_000682 [Candidatus Latescibacterota bacterium]|jgi:hypothetical protein